MAIKAIIFDLDGTITKPFFDFDVIRRDMGLAEGAGPILEIIETMTPSQRTRAEDILHTHEKRAVEQSTLNEGAAETLKTLTQRSIHIGILTRNRTSNARAIAQKHNLRFDAIVGREDGPVKPDAFGVLELCKQFGVKPCETLVVGDYLYDLLSAKAANAIPVLLKNRPPAEDFSEHADYTITSLNQILQIIDDKNSQ